jgi:hypothetical protein
VRARVLTLGALALAGALAFVPGAQAGEGTGFFYTTGPVPIPDGHGAAKLNIVSVLPNDVDPIVDDVNLTIRVKHPQTHDLVITLKRPDYIGTNGAFAGPRVLTMSNRDTHGANFGRGPCPANNPGAAPVNFTTFDDQAPAAIGVGAAPYEGAFKPLEPLSGFSQYHAAPGTPETWTLKVKDVKKGHDPGKVLCAGVYLHRF